MANPVILPALGVVQSTAYVGPASVSTLPQFGASRNNFLIGALGRQVGRIAGTVKDKTTPPPNRPVFERVRLHRQRDGMLIRETWTNPATGAYSFDYIDELQTYYVISIDKEGAFRAVIADRLVPEIIS